MNQEILEYIKSQRVGVLAVEMLDGSPHAATVHYAHTDNPLLFYFETNPEYRKAESLTGRESSRASFVIGSNEGDMRTLQMDGIVRLLDVNVESDVYQKVYLGKFPEKVGKYRDKKFLTFTFEPTWWRFTDWTKPEGKVIITSTD